MTTACRGAATSASSRGSLYRLAALGVDDQAVSAGAVGDSSTVRVHTGPPVPLLIHWDHDLDQPPIGYP